jgi:hypothetical protein
MLSSGYRDRERARTIMLTDIPDAYRRDDGSRLRALCERVGPVESLTRVYKVDDVKSLYEGRKDWGAQLEVLACSYIRTGKRPVMSPKQMAHLIKANAQKRSTLLMRSARASMESKEGKTTAAIGDEEQALPKDPLILAETRFVELDEQLERERERTLRNVALVEGTAFVAFEQQRDALAASQTVMGDGVWRIKSKYLAPDAKDIVWWTIAIPGWQRWVRQLISLGISVGLVIVWGIVVTFVSGIATLDQLINLLPFLAPLNKLPTVILGLIQGLVPALALGLLMAFLSFILTLVSTFEGIPLATRVQLSVMNKYYFFLVVNVLLVVTFATGIMSALNQLKDNPTSAIDVLAANMPKASTFFVTYVLLQTTSAPQQLFMATTVVKKWLFRRIATTPRKVWQVKQMDPVEWGSLFPEQVIMFAIGVTYSSIAPLILIFISAYFHVHYLCQRYLMLYTAAHPSSASISGRMLPRSIYHSFAAIYIYLLTMIGIFSLQKAVGQLISMLVLLCVTIAGNRFMDHGMQRVLSSVPLEAAVRITEQAPQEVEEMAVTELQSIPVEAVPTQQFASVVRNTLSPFTRQHAMEHDIASIASELDSSEDEAEEMEAGRIYLHPSLRRRIPLVWLMQDEAGLAQEMVEELQAKNITRLTVRGATWKQGRINVDMTDEEFPMPIEG